MTAYLIVGGAGFIGSHLVDRLLAGPEDNRVTVYDNLSHGKRKAIPQGADLVVGDVADRDALSNAFRTRVPDAVLHFAALIEAGESMKVPERYFRNNTATTLTLLETMLDRPVSAIPPARCNVSS